MKTSRAFCLVALTVALTWAGQTRADEAELSRRIDILSQEIQKLKNGDAEKKSSEGEGKSSSQNEILGKYGAEGSAAKVYQNKSGVSLGGYGEMLYQTFSNSQQNGQPSTSVDSLDFLRNVLYVGYKFNDSLLFNSEIEIEHAVVASDKTGEVEVEFAYLDYLNKPELNFRAGMLLVPMGLTNEIHEPTSFLGARRNDVETKIIPTTWRENGVGIFGELGPFTYRSFVVAGLNADRFATDSIAEGKEEGVFSKTKSSLGFVLRVDYSATPGLLAGGSVYTGQSASNNDGPPNASGLVSGPTVGTHIYEAHVEWKYKGMDFRTLGAIVRLDDIANYNAVRGYSGTNALGSNMWGAYAQLGYDVLSVSGNREMSLTPFARWERYDTQDNVPGQSGVANPANLATVWTYGMAFKPIEQIVLKADYQLYFLGDQSGVNRLNLAMGYNF